MIDRCYIEITNTCNLNCHFCPKHTREKRQLTAEEFNQLTDKLKGKVCFLYFHLMGEPLLHPLATVYHDGKRKGIQDCTDIERNPAASCHGTSRYTSPQNTTLATFARKQCQGGTVQLYGRGDDLLYTSCCKGNLHRTKTLEPGRKRQGKRRSNETHRKICS